MKEYFQNNLIELSLLQLEKPYIWGATGPNEFDCSGLTYYLFKELFNIDINKTGYGINDTTKQLTSNIGTLTEYTTQDKNEKKYLKILEKGDLIFFHTQSLEDNKPTINNKFPGHVGIYIGNNQFIHASSEKQKIIISKLSDDWLKKLIASKNIINDII